MRQDEATNESIAKVMDFAVARFMQATWASSLILHGSNISVSEIYCPILHGPHLPCNIMEYTNEAAFSSSMLVFDTTQYPCPPTGSSSFASVTPSSTPFKCTKGTAHRGIMTNAQTSEKQKNEDYTSFAHH
jgi:hypothetical protein